MLFTVSVIFDNYLMPRLRYHEDCNIISPRSRTHCHVQIEVHAFLNAVFPGKWTGLWDLSRTLYVLQSCTFSLQGLRIRKGCDICFSDACCPLWTAARITEVETRRTRITEANMRTIILCVFNIPHRHNSVNSTPADSGDGWFQFEPLDAASVQEDFFDLEYLGTATG
jgi:hypothetical protein